MGVGDQGNRAASLIGFPVKNNRSRNRDTNTRAGDDRVDLIELQRRNSVLARVLADLSLVASGGLLELIIEAGGDNHGRSLRLGKELRDSVSNGLVIASFNHLC